MKISIRTAIFILCGLLLWGVGSACKSGADPAAAPTDQLAEGAPPSNADVVESAIAEALGGVEGTEEAAVSSAEKKEAQEYSQTVRNIAEEAANKQSEATDEEEKKSLLADDVESHVKTFIEYAEKKYGRDAIVNAFTEKEEDPAPATLTHLEEIKKEETKEIKKADVKMEVAKLEKRNIDKEIVATYYSVAALNFKVEDEYIKAIPQDALEAAVIPMLKMLKDENASIAEFTMPAADLKGINFVREARPAPPLLPTDGITDLFRHFQIPTDENGDPRDPDFTVTLDFSESTPPPGPYNFFLGGAVGSGNKQMSDDLLYDWMTIGDQNNGIPVWFKDPASVNAEDTFKVRANGLINGHLASIAVKNVTWNPSTTEVQIQVKRRSAINPSPNSWKFSTLQPLCPRVKWNQATERYYYDAYVHVDSIPHEPYDPFYFPYPRFIEQQPDFNTPGQQAFANNPNIYDGCNMLTIDKVIARFDYENEDQFSSWEAGFYGNVSATAPISGTQPSKSERLFDYGSFATNLSTTGIESNFYFVTMPCRPEWYESDYENLGGLNYEPNWLNYFVPPNASLWKTQIQPLLHILQGERDGHRGQFEDPSYWIDNEIALETSDHQYFAQTFAQRYPPNELPPPPSHRLQGFLPSLFEGATAGEPQFGRDSDGNALYSYTKCEWHDTFSQAPYQELEYRNFAIWDWDTPTNANEEPACVVVAFFEADDVEKYCYSSILSLCGFPAYQHPTDLSEDLIALFKVERNNIQPMYYNNKHNPDLPTNKTWDFAVSFANRRLPNCPPALMRQEVEAVPQQLAPSTDQP